MHTQNDLFSLQKPETTGLYTHNLCAIWIGLVYCENIQTLNVVMRNPSQGYIT